CSGWWRHAHRRSPWGLPSVMNGERGETGIGIRTMRHGATPSTITLRRSVHPEYGLQHAEAARVGVHLHHAAMRDDELLADVSDHRAAIGRHAQRLDVIVEDLVEGERAETLARIAVGAFAEDESGDPVERAHQLERGEHAVDAIRRFLH